MPMAEAGLGPRIAYSERHSYSAIGTVFHSFLTFRSYQALKEMFVKGVNRDIEGNFTRVNCQHQLNVYRQPVTMLHILLAFI